MSVQQVQNFRLLKKLLQQLKTYGLNPNDWRIERTTWSQGHFSIQHRNDSQFRLDAQWITVPHQAGNLIGLELSSI